MSPSLIVAIASSWTAPALGSGPSPGDIATRANELFGRDDTGVAMRLIGLNYTYPWWACKNHTTPTCAPEDASRRLSVLLLNKYMVDESVPGGRFPWNAPEWNLAGGNALGYIATNDFTREHTRCFYPLDGNTFSRQDDGCGPMWGTGKCTFSTEPQWCDSVPQDITDEECFSDDGGFAWWRGCAGNLSQFPDVLQAFREVKVADNYNYSGAWNELVLDGEAWNTKVDSNLWAWVAAPKCLGDPQCSHWFFNYTAEYEQAFHSKKPILVLGDDLEKPFSVYAASSASILI